MARKAPAPGTRAKPASKAAAPLRATRKAAAPKRAPAPRRPPEIPAAKWKAYSPGYKKRLAGFYRKHPGQPLHRARGKQAGESLSRRDRLTLRIEALAARQAYRGQKQDAREAGEIAASYRRLIRDKGQGAFGALERIIANRRKGQGRITAEELGFDWEDYDGEPAELFYN